MGVNGGTDEIAYKLFSNIHSVIIHYFEGALISGVKYRPVQTTQLALSVEIQLLNVAVIYY